MVVPAGAELLRGACGWAPRSSTRSRRPSSDRGLSTAVGDEGGFAPDLESNEAALEVLVEGIEAAGYEPGRDVLHRPRPGDERDLRETAPTSSSTRAAPVAEEMADYWADAAERYPIVSIEDGMDEEDWDGWKAAHRAPRRPRASSSATTSSSPTPSGCGAGSSARVGQLDPRQGEPDRDPDRDPRGDPHGPRRRLHGGHLAPLGGDRGHDDRRPRRRDRRRPDQARPAARNGHEGAADVAVSMDQLKVELHAFVPRAGRGWGAACAELAGRLPEHMN